MTRNRISVGRKPKEMSARPWSKLIDRKFLNMNNNVPVDDLLKIVDPSLVTKYEENVLHKNHETRSIAQINEEYKKVSIRQKKLSAILDKVYSISTAVLVVALGYGVCFTQRSVSYVVALCILFLIFIFGIILLGFCSKKLGEHNKVLSSLRLHLEEFRDTVEVLHSPLIPDAYVTKGWIREILNVCAIHIVVAEKGLDEVRLRKERRTTEIRFYCDRIRECQHQLNQVLTTAEKFGIAVDKSELFNTAEQRIKENSE